MKLTNKEYISTPVYNCDYKKIPTLLEKRERKKEYNKYKKKRLYTTNTEILIKLEEQIINQDRAIFNCNLTCVINIVTVIAFLTMLIMFR